MQNKVALVGTGPECQTLLNIFRNLPEFKVIGILSMTAMTVPLKHFCDQAHLLIADSYDQFYCLAPDIIFLCTALPMNIKINEIYSRPAMIDYVATRLLCRTFTSITNQLDESEERQKKYLSALNATNEGIQIMNENGIIEYINPAFSRITGIHSLERIGTSIYNVSPDGAGSQALKTSKPAIGIINQAVGSCAEVISNGAPIFINNKLRGAVVFFQEATDILHLSQELNKSKVLIESLSDELSYTKSSKYTFEDLIGTNKKLLEVINLSKRAAKIDSTVLITGESGTGKEILTNAIHHASPRWKKPFITVNCAAIPDTLIESELFGHEKGAFTGADKTKVGKFELANGGTIFLDEIGDLNFNVQAKLLRVLQEKEVERIGSSERLTIDVKILAATNKNLLQLVKNGLFREDLYYRLQVIIVKIPPLRERKDDIPLLADYLVRKICQKSNQIIPQLAPESLKLLQTYSWPGNIRELENCLTRGLMICDGKTLRPNNFRFLFQTPQSGVSMDEEPIVSLDELYNQMLTRALKKYGMSTAGKKLAAQALHISLGTLYYKIKHYKLDNL